MVRWMKHFADIIFSCFFGALRFNTALTDLLSQTSVFGIEMWVPFHTAFHYHFLIIIKKKFMLIFAEHEIFPAHEY